MKQRKVLGHVTSDKQAWNGQNESCACAVCARKTVTFLVSFIVTVFWMNVDSFCCNSVNRRKFNYRCICRWQWPSIGCNLGVRCGCFVYSKRGQNSPGGKEGFPANPSIRKKNKRNKNEKEKYVERIYFSLLRKHWGPLVIEKADRDWCYKQSRHIILRELIWWDIT